MSIAVYDNYGICQEAKNYFRYMTNPPQGNAKKAYNAFITYLLRTGDFAKLDRLFLMDGHDQQAARVSINHNGTMFFLNEVASITWDRFMGYKGNGTTQYLDSVYNPTTGGVNFTLNSSSMFVYCRDNLNDAGAELGAIDATNGSYVSAMYSDNKQYTRPNNATAVGTTVSNSIGLSGWNRTASNAYATYRDGVISKARHRLIVKV